jgi:hypothetical protein
MINLKHAGLDDWISNPAAAVAMSSPISNLLGEYLSERGMPLRLALRINSDRRVNLPTNSAASQHISCSGPEFRAKRQERPQLPTQLTGCGGLEFEGQRQMDLLPALAKPSCSGLEIRGKRQAMSTRLGRSFLELRGATA